MFLDFFLIEIRSDFLYENLLFLYIVSSQVEGEGGEESVQLPAVQPFLFWIFL